MSTYGPEQKQQLDYCENRLSQERDLTLQNIANGFILTLTRRFHTDGVEQAKQTEQAIAKTALEAAAIAYSFIAAGDIPDSNRPQMENYMNGKVIPDGGQDRSNVPEELENRVADNIGDRIGDNIGDKIGDALSEGNKVDNSLPGDQPEVDNSLPPVVDNTLPPAEGLTPEHPVEPPPAPTPTVKRR